MVWAHWAHVLACPTDMVIAVEDELRSAVKHCHPSIRFDTISTLLVGRTIGERLHLDGDELHGCIFGCTSMPDGLPH